MAEDRDHEDLVEGLKNAGMTEAEALAEAEKLEEIERQRRPWTGGSLGTVTTFRNPGPCVDWSGHSFRAADNRINISVCSRCGKQVDW